MAINDIIAEIIKKHGIPMEEIRSHLIIAETLQKEIFKEINVGGRQYKVKKTAMGPVITDYGRFYQINFEVSDEWNKYMCLIKSELDKKNDYLPIFNPEYPIYLRIDSGCEPGQGFYDKMCDCKEQLELAIKNLGEADQGIIIHIPSQDGRGKGTAFHLATLYLQEKLNLNTVESFGLLEGDINKHNLDCRTYEGSIAILKFLGIQDYKVVFGTNNPLKLEPLIKEGFNIMREPVIIKPTEYTKHHLGVKQSVLGHMLED